jgi:hypothetical protein
MTLEYENTLFAIKNSLISYRHCKGNTFILFTGLDNIKYGLIFVIYMFFRPQITFFKLKHTHLTSF